MTPEEIAKEMQIIYEDNHLSGEVAALRAIIEYLCRLISSAQEDIEDLKKQK